MKGATIPAVIAAFVILFGHHASASNPIFIGIDSSGVAPRYDVNRVSKTLPELRTWLESVIETFGSVDPLILDPDDATTAATLATVLDTVRAAGGRQVTLRSTPDFDFGLLRYWLFALPEPPKAPLTYDVRRVDPNG